MKSGSLGLGLVIGALLASAGSAAGQTSWAEAQVADLEDMHEKFVALAEAFPHETYAWRPMEGVRSVREVFALMAAECNLFPTLWGYEAAEGVAEGFRDEMTRLTAMSDAELVAEMDASFGRFADVVKGMSEEDRAREVDFFGRQVALSTAIALAAFDMHEHLGQAIAYARTNEVVPPWSQGM